MEEDIFLQDQLDILCPVDRPIGNVAAYTNLCCWIVDQYLNYLRQHKARLETATEHDEHVPHRISIKNVTHLVMDIGDRL